MNYIKLWKKGFFYSLIVAVIAFLVSYFTTVMTIGDVDSIKAITNAGIIVLIVSFIAMPVVYGYLIEWINKKVK